MLASKIAQVEQPDYGQPQVREHITNRAQRRASEARAHRLDKLSILGCIIAAVAVMWMLAYRGGQIDAMNYSIDGLQTQIQRTSAENASLNAQVDKLKRPTRILAIAEGPLHMKQSTPIHIPAH